VSLVRLSSLIAVDVEPGAEARLVLRIHLLEADRDTAPVAADDARGGVEGRAVDDGVVRRVLVRPEAEIERAPGVERGALGAAERQVAGRESALLAVQDDPRLRADPLSLVQPSLRCHSPHLPGSYHRSLIGLSPRMK